MLSNSGAKNEALASLTATSTDEWSLWRNPAGLSSIAAPVASFGVRRAPGINALTRSMLAAHNMKFGTLAGGVSAFGDDIYNEQALSLAFASHIGLAAVGIRADAMQLHIDGSSTRRSLGVSLGAIANLSSRLSVGICARNINLPEWARGQSLPVILNTGISFKPSDSFFVAAEVEKNTDFNPTFKGAVEYSLHRKFFMRSGFNLFPNAAFGGIGLRTWRLGFDYALKFGYLPGYSHQLSIAIHINKKKREC